LSKRPPTGPAGSTESLTASGPFYVIGDVHGCAAELVALIDKLELNEDSAVVMVGDYVDRGPDSKQVIEVILELSTRCHLMPLLGNHDGMFLSFLSDPSSQQAVTFIYNGGGATLASYANEDGSYRIPREHVALLHDLRLWFETPEYFVVHAGVPDTPLETLDPALDWEELLWTRNMRTTTYQWSKVIVHGHTATRDVQILPNQINVDTACVFENRLSAIELPSRRVISVNRGAGSSPKLLTDRNSRRSSVRFQGSARVRLLDQGRPCDFETVNYSQTGMLIRWTGEGPEPRTRPDQMVGGVIGAGSASALAFTAAMVRREARPEGLFFGLRLLPPYGGSEIGELARGLVLADEAAEDAQWSEILGKMPEAPAKPTKK
jgi:serine/threonine protein phosphatase 1